MTLDFIELPVMLEYSIGVTFRALSTDDHGSEDRTTVKEFFPEKLPPASYRDEALYRKLSKLLKKMVRQHCDVKVVLLARISDEELFRPVATVTVQ